MKRTALFFLIFCALASAQAQTYFGGDGAQLISSSSGSVPLVSVQAGGRAAPEFGHLEVRAAFDTLLLFSDLSLDAFASVRPYDAPLRVYFGGGLNMLLRSPRSGTRAGEVSRFFRTPRNFRALLSKAIRPFTELQPAAALLYGEPVFGPKARAGVNVYF